MTLPTDYVERVYAGVLGKTIGVYLGRPFEGWHYEEVMERLGEVWYYVHDRLGQPLIVTDDDLSGTFTFLRALPDNGYAPNLTAAQIGQNWLNYIIPERTILWWGGMGTSTEHTAYLRLKNGIPAPRSGSMALNSQVVAEQIGAQIFIDGWAMVAPGDPEKAADLAGRAARVSHDGEAVYGAQALAAMEALAFVESNLNVLLDRALALIPTDSTIARLIGDLREWHAAYPDWRKARDLLDNNYGYDTYGGGVHIVPNHGVIILSLLYGADDFQRSLMIANTCGWDTDCNSGNVGCLLGIKNGLASIEAGPDWRGPVADRLYLPTADGGRAITDAVTETLHVANTGRALAGLPPLAPKDGARFHFELPGAVQGFQPDAPVTLENVAGHSANGTRSLALHYHHLGPELPAHVGTATFIPPDALDMPGYELLASPTIYPGQQVRARVEADSANAVPVRVRLYAHTYETGDTLHTIYSPASELTAGQAHTFSWQIPDLAGKPVMQIGLALDAQQHSGGTLYLDYLGWNGTPDVTFTPRQNAEIWTRAWVNGVDRFHVAGNEDRYLLVQNAGTGLAIQGTREWTDYRVEGTVEVHLAEQAGIAARVQGMRRYYALLLARDSETGSRKARLVKALAGETVLAEVDFAWEFDVPVTLALQVEGNQLRGWLDGAQVFDVEDSGPPLDGGGVAMLLKEGRMLCGPVRVQPAVD